MNRCKTNISGRSAPKAAQAILAKPGLNPNQRLAGLYWDRSSSPGFLRAIKNKTEKKQSLVLQISCPRGSTAEKNNNNSSSNNTSKCLLTIAGYREQRTEFSYELNFIKVRSYYVIALMQGCTTFSG